MVNRNNNVPLSEAAVLSTQWKDADGKIISNPELIQWISDSRYEILNGTKQLIIGTDSHRHGNFYWFITVVCLYQSGRGGYYYYNKTQTNKFEFRGASQSARVRARMFHEATLAIELATEIQEKTGFAPIVHMDASPTGSHELTAAFSEDLKGYAIASGFEAVVKPWAFVSSGIANKHTKA